MHVHLAKMWPLHAIMNLEKGILYILVSTPPRTKVVEFADFSYFGVIFGLYRSRKFYIELLF